MFERADFLGSFQGPEGGIEEGEDELETAYREIQEEIGITKDKLKLLSKSERCFKYNYSEDCTERHGCIEQEKLFFLFEFLGDESEFSYNDSGKTQEFKGFKLMNVADAIKVIPEFKRKMYERVFECFKGFLK
jgi:putative (di)nucleoside polyphosphate hydrolase